MENYQFARTARNIRRKAVLFTIAFHALLVFGVAAMGDISLTDYLPDSVKELVGMDTPKATPAKDNEVADTVRP